jgi:signal transduction histidine kinase
MAEALHRASTRSVLLIATAIATTLAFAIAAQTYLSMRTHGHSFLRMLVWQLACWSFWALAAPLAVRAGEALAASSGDARRQMYVRAAALGIVLAAGHAILAAIATVWLQPFTPLLAPRFGDALLDQLGFVLVMDLLAYGAVLLVGTSLAVYDRARRLELRESRLEAQLTRANLEALRLEIQPHFLFNTLNTIGALMRRNSVDRALEMLVGLGELLRETLDHRRGDLSTVEAEVDFVRKYVDLYRARFSDRLTVAFVVDARALDCRIPAFVLQPLVENAFRHGVAQQVAPCRVEIGARLEQGTLRLWVADDGPGVAPDFDAAARSGTGISNVRSRLECLFGAAASVTIRPGETGGTLAEITIPSTAPATVAYAAS